MVISLAGNQTIEKKGAIGEAFSETIKLLESQMGGPTSAYVPKPTVLVAGRHHIPSAANNKASIPSRHVTRQ